MFKTKEDDSRGAAETRSSRSTFGRHARTYWRALRAGKPTMRESAKRETRLRVSAAPRESTSSARNREDGYTLMELLVVLAILGLLTSIGTVMVLRYLDNARLGTAKTEIANYSAGLDLFKYDVGRYPTTQEGLDSLLKAPPTAENWNGPYLKSTTNLNDPWGHAFVYRSPGEHGEFDLYSYGPKGKEGASDANPPIKNW